MTEFELIDRYFKRATPSALTGNGDDCAVIAPRAGFAFAVTTDTLIEGRHFLPTIKPQTLGRRSMVVNFSDLAAMGAQPRYAMLSLTLPSLDETWLQDFSTGLWSTLDQHQVELIGGNTTRGPLSISVTAFGELRPDQTLLRSGAQVDDELWVSGYMGDAGWGLYALLGHEGVEATAAQIAHYEDPVARVDLGVALRGIASSCIDVSDGLMSEAVHLAKASAVVIEIYFEALPHNLHKALEDSRLRSLALHCLLNSGDAYELLFTAPAAQHDTVAKLLNAQGLSGTCIGHVRAAAPNMANTVSVLDRYGAVMNVSASGWDHFSQSEPA